MTASEPGATCARCPYVPTTNVLGNASLDALGYGPTGAGFGRTRNLQRIYGTAWATKDESGSSLSRLAEAEKRDHRELGAEPDLFSFPDEIGPGLAVFPTPRAASSGRPWRTTRACVTRESGHEFVSRRTSPRAVCSRRRDTPTWYADSMYPPMHLDEERDADGTIRKQGQDYYLKPMNCPFHRLIFRARGRSYRELPLRLFEFGSVYRFEKSGVIHGLTRVRGMTQDDCHIFVTPEQVQSELKRC